MDITNKIEINNLISKNVNELDLEQDILNKKFSIYHDKYIFAIIFIQKCLKDFIKIDNKILYFYNNKDNIWENFTKSIELKYMHRIVREFIPNAIKEEIIVKINFSQFMRNLSQKYNNDIEDNKRGDIIKIILKILENLSKLDIKNFLIKLKNYI